jgi:endoglucanase
LEGGGSYAACAGFVSTGAGAAFLTLSDPQNELIAACHAYTDSNNEGNTDYAAQGRGLSSVTSATTYASANGIKLFLGETGVGFTPSSYAEEKAMFDYMAANPSVWIGWTAWGGGPNWGENYYFLFEPRATNYNPVVTPFIDRPMMRFLNTYATGHSWPSASGAWPYNVQFP